MNRNAWYRGRLAGGGPDWQRAGYTDEYECLGQYQAALGSMAGYEPGQVVFDLGCGPGNGLTIFPDLIGCDVLEESVQEANRTVCDRFHVGDHTSIPDTVDWVLMLGIFNVGYKWTDVRAAFETSWSQARRGVAVAFLRSTFGDPQFGAWPLHKWLALGQRMSPRWILRADWSAVSYVMTVIRV